MCCLSRMIFTKINLIAAILLFRPIHKCSSTLKKDPSYLLTCNRTTAQEIANYLENLQTNLYKRSMLFLLCNSSRIALPARTFPFQLTVTAPQVQRTSSLTALCNPSRIAVIARTFQLAVTAPQVQSSRLHLRHLCPHHSMPL